ncbi:hypothetical protein SAMN04488119_106203, partial [Oceanicella actignis]|uniref:DUF7146 domain-containing protein n=1 Tax=Oceanicella actignis TaxID=1189325 RepID=UPI0008D84845
MADARTLTQDLGGRWFGAYRLAPRPVCQPERRRDQAAPSIAQGRGGRLLLRCHKAGCGFADILRAAGLAPGAPSRPDPEAEARRMAELAAQRKRRDGAAWRIWQEARPARGTLAEAYLRGRHIAFPEGAALRLHPSAPHPTGARLSAMVAQIDGDQGGAVRLIAPPEGGPPPIGEGIETTLAAAAMWGAPCGAWAAPSATGMATLNLAHIP